MMQAYITFTVIFLVLLSAKPGFFYDDAWDDAMII